MKRSDKRAELTAEIGDRVKVRVTVTNAGRLPVPWVLLEDVLPRDALDKRFPRLKVKGKRLRIAMLSAGGEMDLDYTVECLTRGYFQIGPLVLENGDLFGLHRRFRVDAEPAFLLVYPRIVPLEGYDLTSRRPIGDVLLTHRLFEDPTRISGVRPYELGDPLNRVHWRATARTGALHSKVHEPSTLAGATVLLDFHQAGYPRARRAVPLRAGGDGGAVAGQRRLRDGPAGRPRHQRPRRRRPHPHRRHGRATDPRTRQAARAAAADDRGKPSLTSVDRRDAPRRRAVAPHPRNAGPRRADRRPDLRRAGHGDDEPAAARRHGRGGAAGRAGGDGDRAGRSAPRRPGDHGGADPARREQPGDELRPAHRGRRTRHSASRRTRRKCRICAANRWIDRRRMRWFDRC